MPNSAKGERRWEEEEKQQRGVIKNKTKESEKLAVEEEEWPGNESAMCV